MRRAGLILCVMLVGCSRTQSDSNTSSDPSPVGETTLTSAEVPSASVTFLEPEPQLTRRVELAIAEDPVLGLAAKNVGISVESGVATLRGSVADEEHRRDLDRVVGSVPGVTRTDSQVEVSTVRDANNRESDETIAFALQRSFASLPSVGDDSETVSIDVLDGHVVLRGSTSFVTTRDEVERIAATTPGVVAVESELTVEP